MINVETFDIKKATELEMQEIWMEATEAGVERAENASVSTIKISGYPAFPTCGFAWVIVKPGNSRFANWLKKNELGRTDSYYGGVMIYISYYGQGMDQKYAHACGMSSVFNKYGIKSYPMSRID